MPDFVSLLGGLDAAIDAHLRDGAFLRPVGGGADRPVRVVLEHPVESERFEGAGFVRTRPTVEISKSSTPLLAKGDIVLIGSVAPYQGWRLAETPIAPGDGRHWRVEVEPLGLIA